MTSLRGGESYAPPISAVLTLPELMTSKVAVAMLLARLSRLRKGGSVLKSYTREENGIPKMSEHHGSAQNHGGGVGTVSPHDVTGNMTTTGFEQGVFLKALTSKRMSANIRNLYIRDRHCIQERYLGHRPGRHQCWTQ